MLGFEYCLLNSKPCRVQYGAKQRCQSIYLRAQPAATEVSAVDESAEEAVDDESAPPERDAEDTEGMQLPHITAFLPEHATSRKCKPMKITTSSSWQPCAYWRSGTTPGH